MITQEGWASHKLRRAAADLRYLLNYLTSKGYEKRGVVRLVGDRYLLYRSMCEFSAWFLKV